jgi:hypothetical protein
VPGAVVRCAVGAAVTPLESQEPMLRVGLSALALIWMWIGQIHATEAVAPEPSKEVLTAVIDAQLSGLKEKDVDLMMDTMHPKSPVYEGTRNLLDGPLKTLDLTIEYTDAEYLGKTGEYALLRCKQKTVNHNQVPFKDNVIDVIHVFKVDGSKWKFWQMTTLSTEFIDP